jgi:hypothetical protein
MGSQTEKVEASERDTSDQGYAVLSSSPASPTTTKRTTSNNSDKKDASRSASPAPAESTSTATNSGNGTKSPSSEASGEARLNDATATPPSSTDGATVPTATVTAPTAVASATPSTDDEPRCLDVNSATLQFDTISDALSDGLMGREPITIINDDVSTVKTATNARSWIQKLVEAFGKNYLPEPEDTKKHSPSQKLWWARWQKQGHASVVAIFEAENKGLVHLEKSCWHLFDAVIKAHELGVITSPSANNNALPSKLKCSARLAFIVSTLEKYALVRLDVLRSWHVNEIATNPEIFVKRKVTNCWNNGNRAEKLARKQRLDAAAAGKTRGRKRAAASAVDVESSEPEQDSDEAPVKAKRARKSAAATVGDGTPKTDRKGKSKASASVKDSHSATPETSGSDEPSATGVQDDEDEDADVGDEAGSGAEAGMMTAMPNLYCT